MSPSKLSTPPATNRFRSRKMVRSSNPIALETDLTGSSCSRTRSTAAVYRPKWSSERNDCKGTVPQKTTHRSPSLTTAKRLSPIRRRRGLEWDREGGLFFRKVVLMKQVYRAHARSQYTLCAKPNSLRLRDRTSCQCGSRPAMSGGLSLCSGSPKSIRRQQHAPWSGSAACNSRPVSRQGEGPPAWPRAA